MPNPLLLCPPTQSLALEVAWSVINHNSSLHCWDETESRTSLLLEMKPNLTWIKSWLSWMTIFGCRSFCVLMCLDVFWCVLMPFDVFWCLLMPLDAFWFWLMPVDTVWCLLMPFDAFWCLLMPFDVFWCLLMPFDYLWCLLIPFGALWCILRLSRSVCLSIYP